MSTEPRDARRAPRPGDMLACGETLVRVDRVSVELDEVLVTAFRLDSMQPSDRPRAVRLSEWAEATKGAGVVVLPEDDPRHSATILEAPR